MTEIELLASPWDKVFYHLVSLVKSELLIASPFISSQPIKAIADILDRQGTKDQIKVAIVTNLGIDNLLSGSLDIAALLDFVAYVPNSTVTYLPSLHAKLYIVDLEAVVVTSSNLTYSGLRGNHEYGVLLRNSELVSRARTDLIGYASLGNQVSYETLAALAQVTQELKTARQKADKSVNVKFRAIFEQKLQQTQIELFKARARGKTTHGIFCETILYILDRYGPLTTAEMHPLIQQIHPDMCDDSIDRVIDGQVQKFL